MFAGTPVRRAVAHDRALLRFWLEMCKRRDQRNSVLGAWRCRVRSAGSGDADHFVSRVEHGPAAVSRTYRSANHAVLDSVEHLEARNDTWVLLHSVPGSISGEPEEFDGVSNLGWACSHLESVTGWEVVCLDRYDRDVERLFLSKDFDGVVLGVGVSTKRLGGRLKHVGTSNDAVP